MDDGPNRTIGPELARLDTLLEAALKRADEVYGPGVATDPFRGLHLDPSDLLADLQRGAGEPLLFGGDPARPELLGPLGWMSASFGLGGFDLDVVLVALAPEVDLRYQRIYAYLQDDVSRRAPSVDLALNLLCASPAQRLSRRAHFGADGPLLRHDLLRLAPPVAQPGAALLAHTLHLDPQIVDVLLEQGGLDRRLAGFCRLLPPVDDPGPGVDDRVVEWMRSAVAGSPGRPLRLYLHGRAGDGRMRTARAVAASAGRPLLFADLRRTAGVDAVRLVFREALLHDAILYLDGVDDLRRDELGWAQLLDRLQAATGITLLAGSLPWPAPDAAVTGTTTLRFAPLTARQRLTVWQSSVGSGVDSATLDLLAARYRLTVSEIEDAAACAASLGGGTPGVLAAARSRSGHELAALTRRVEPRARWADLVVPADALAQLREICARVRHREQVLTDWAFATVLNRGRGTSALFSGPAGTGKTMAAEVIAAELALDLCTIDLAGVVSKYIGETEKNLDRIFDAATDANAVLFFDEADALFGKRSEVRDSHDRYANLEISYLLQRIEEYDGIAILATNLRHHLDEAFLRRLAFSVAFPLPDAAGRARIWEVTWPEALPLASDVDLGWFAERFALSGGNIRNVALAAAYLAADDGHVVRTAHLLHAVRREYQKLGKALTDAELGVSAA